MLGQYDPGAHAYARSSPGQKLPGAQGEHPLSVPAQPATQQYGAVYGTRSERAQFGYTGGAKTTTTAAEDALLAAALHASSRNTNPTPGWPARPAGHGVGSTVPGAAQ